MSFSVPPLSDLYPTPLVGETQSATERRHDQELPGRHRSQQQRKPADAPAPDEPSAQPADPDANPTIGTLINVRA